MVGVPFRVPGLTFMLLLGRGMGATMRPLCSVRSSQRFLNMSDEIDKANAQMALALFASSRPVGRLISQSPPHGFSAPVPPWPAGEITKLANRPSGKDDKNDRSRSRFNRHNAAPAQLANRRDKMIEDHAALAEVRRSWGGVRQLQRTIQASAMAS